MVYDAIPGAGVRQLPLADYLISQQPTDIQLLHPTKPFSETQVAAFERHLQAQIGRQYDVKHFATGRRCSGLHCSEYVTDALVASQLVTSDNPARVSPSGLITSLTEHHLYQTGTTHNLPEAPTPAAPVSETWYGRAWQGTKSCSYDCWVQTRRWFCCKYTTRRRSLEPFDSHLISTIMATRVRIPNKTGCGRFRTAIFQAVLNRRRGFVRVYSHVVAILRRDLIHVRSVSHPAGPKRFST